MACCQGCQQQELQTGFPMGQAPPLEFSSMRTPGNSTELMFYIQGVRTGMQIRQAETAALTRLGMFIALGVGAATILRHFWGD